MKLYQTIIRVVFGVIFVGGGISHLILGRLQPEGYAVFGETALLPWLGDLWVTFVMPNIGWLTIVLGIYEIGCGMAMIWERTVVIGVWGMLVFLVFITIVGYGFSTESLGEDLVKNRVITAVMAALLIPVLFAEPEPAGAPSRR